MNILQLRPQVKELEIKLPTGESTGIIFKVVGQDSKQFKAVSGKWIELSLDAAKGKKVNPDQMFQARAEMAAACVVGWSNLDDENDLPIPYSPEKALELLAQPEFSFIVEQLDAFVTERVNFFRKSEAAAS